MSSRRRRLARRRRKTRSTFARAALVILGTVLIMTLAGTATAAALVSSWLADLPNLDDPKAFRVAQTTKIYAGDGRLMASLFLENRELVKLKGISPHLQHAVVAVEDERFYEHRGVDIYGIMRAAVRDIASGSVEEGASTITQQYVRNTILQKERTEVTPARKIREAVLARELEKRHHKDDILTSYLNTVYFGEGAYGAEAAAKTFFGKNAKDLTLAESAMLAGLPQSPSKLSPYENMDGAKVRQKHVLNKMHENRYIEDAEYKEALAEPIKLKRVQSTEGVYEAPYFVAHVKKVLQERFDQATVFKGGLKVYTTLDPKLQDYAEEAVADTLNLPNDPDCALVSIDPRNGYVKAMVGGRDFEKNKFNFATQAHRQPGSSFKTFVLVTALEKGVPPYRTINGGSPVTISSRPKPWVVRNSEGHGTGYIPISSAIKHSVNTVFAQLIHEVGADEVAKTAKRMGIRTPIPAFLSIGLGSAEVTPLEMTSAYGTLATNGIYYSPVTVTKVVDADGKTIFEQTPHGSRALSKEIAYSATRLLEGVIQGGTGTRARIGRPAAGKTGTSQENRDAWFIGYTPQLVTGVWQGYTPERPMYSVHGRRNYGGTWPSEVWRRFMSKALSGQPALRWQYARSPRYKWKSTWSRTTSTTAEPKTGTGTGTGTTKPPVKKYSPPVAPRPEPPPPADGGGQKPPDNGGGGQKPPGGGTDTTGSP